MVQTKIQDSAVEKMLGKRLSKEIKTYLEEGEQVVAVLRETYGPDLTIRRFVLTSQRLVIAIVRLAKYEFHDIFLESIDIEYDKGFFFDNLRLRGGLEDYTGHVYAAKRKETLKFIEKVREERDKSFKREDERQIGIAEEGSGELGESHGITHALRELATLKEEGNVTEEEFEKNKKILLDKL